MSGVEVILGVIPLLIEVAEYSHTVYQQFKRWRKYYSELEDFQNELCCYQCVFRTDCTLLLHAVTTTAEYDRIMERNVTELESQRLERNLRSYLNDQYDCCRMIMEKIKKELNVLDDKSQRFQDAITVPDSIQNEGIEKRALRSLRAKGAKAEFIMTGQALKKRLAILERHRDTFHMILEQARTVEYHRRTGQTRFASLPNSTDDHSLLAPDDSILLKITSIQTAAKKLHKAMLDSCRTPNESTLYLRLQMWHRDETEFDKVSFDLRLHPLSRDDTKSSSFSPQLRTTGLALDRSDTRYTEPYMEPLQDISNLGKRRRQSLSILSDIKWVKANDWKKRAPHSAFTLRNEMDGMSIGDDAPPEYLPNDISNEPPSTMYPSNAWHAGQTSTGIDSPHHTEYKDHLALTKTAKDLGHQVILNAAPFDLPPPTSLADHISDWPPRNHNHTYLAHEILFLAKHLASAVLNFHETPFLPENWTSQNIALFDTGEKSTNKRRPLTDPHLKVLIPHRLKQDNDFELVSSRPRIMIRNSYTFTLGIILIELAHQTPWQRLEDENCPDEDDVLVTKFDLVDRLAVGMTTVYGCDYKRIVQKCINCDFGEGEDLGSERLRMVFYRDVICVLEKMEQDFMELFQKER